MATDTVSRYDKPTVANGRTGNDKLRNRDSYRRGEFPLRAFPGDTRRQPYCIRRNSSRAPLGIIRFLGALASTSAAIAAAVVASIRGAVATGVVPLLLKTTLRGVPQRFVALRVFAPRTRARRTIATVISVAAAITTSATAAAVTRGARTGAA